MRAPFIAALILAAALVTPALSAPFPTVDQNPLLNGFAFAPSAQARLPASGSTLFSATLNWSNTAAVQEAYDEQLIVDAESREWRISLTHALSDRLALRIQLPYRTSNGGTLDGFVDNWHSLLGLPNGDRPLLPQNDFRIDYERAGETAASYGQGTSSIGDVSMGAGYQLSATPTRATSVWFNIKAPTGSSAELTGSGATDVALSLVHEHRISSRWHSYAQLNFAYLGTGELLPTQQSNSMWSGLLAFDYRYSKALTLTLQIDGHTAAFADSDLDMLGTAWILTVGGEYRWQSRWYLQVGVSEDVKVEASPDVNFVLSVGRGWK
jgi:hypothetical protein